MDFLSVVFTIELIYVIMAIIAGLFLKVSGMSYKEIFIVLGYTQMVVFFCIGVGYLVDFILDNLSFINL